MQQESPLSDNESTPHGSPGEKGPAKITRRSHRKSRAGCKNCKTRRVKCDEVKPRCGNCKRRHVVCDFDPRASIISRAHNEGEVADSDNLRTSEIELTYHWATSTCYSLSAWQTGATRWQTVVEDVGLQNEHVLHLIFALTALHLASCRPDRQDEYFAKADYHYESALAVVSSEIAEIGAHNCDAVLMSVQLICFINWAKGPKPGEYLAFGEHGRSQWLVMFRGIRTTLDHFGSVPFSLTHGPATRSVSRPLPQMCAPMNYVEQLSELHEHIAFLSAIGSASEEDILAVNVLKECYDSRYGGIDSEYHVAFAWLYRMPESFLDRLQLREATCLIIYAHFAVLMHDMERFWYMKGWTHHVMGGIFTALPTEHRTWIRWPMAQVGWIPS